MSPNIVCLGLAASLPVAAVGWLAGSAIDGAGAGPGQRHAIWEAGFWAAPFTSAAVLVAPRLSMGALRGVLRLPETSASALSSAGMSAPSHAPPVALVVLAVVLTGAAFRLARLALRLRRLAQVRDRAAPMTAFGGLPVRLSHEVASPLLAGLRRPTILLPLRYGASDAADAAALVCRHEAAHARRWDNLRLMLEEIAVAVLWFNPVLASARGRLSAAREEVCDAVAVGGLDARERRLYARNLLDCLEATRASNLPATGLIGLNRRSMTMRIAAILTPKPQRRRTGLMSGLFGALAVSATAAVALAGAQTPAESSIKSGPINITADRLDVDNSHRTLLYIGSASVSGITKSNMDRFFIDGRPATEADLATLPKTLFASIKATRGAHELDRLDAQTKAVAPN